MTGAVQDSNILIDALNGNEEALEWLTQSSAPAISVVTWMEVLAGIPESRIRSVRSFLERFERLELTQAVMEESVQVRRGSRLKLMDAIILATARVNGRVLVTRNTRDFSSGDSSIWVPYQV